MKRICVVALCAILVMTVLWRVFSAGEKAPWQQRVVAAVSAASQSAPAATEASVAASAVSNVAESESEESAVEAKRKKWQFATEWRRESAPELKAFSEWAASYVAAPAEERAAMERAGIELAQARRPVFWSMIQTSPKSALGQTVPAAVRAQLPESVVANLEERVSAKGDLRVVATTSAETAGRSTVSRRVVIEGERWTAHVFGERLAQKTMENVSLHGVAMDGHIAVSESPVRLIEAGEEAPDKPLADGSCPVSGIPTAEGSSKPKAGAIGLESGDRAHWLCSGGHIRATEELVNSAELPAMDAYRTAGARGVLLMMVDLAEAPGGAVDATTAQARLESVSEFLETNSFGQISFTRRVVTPVLRVPRTKAQYLAGDLDGAELLLSDARAAARARGYDPAGYDFDVVVFPHIGYPWSGMGYVGAKGAWVQDLPAGTLAHELGHNLGLWHANSWVSSTTIGSSGTHREYGNIFSVMGSSGAFPNNHFTANGKFMLNWLPGSKIHTATAAATCRIYAHDMTQTVAGDRYYAIRIPAGLARGGIVQDYWVELKHGLTTRYPATGQGVIVQWADDAGTDAADRLLDMNPGTQTMEDAPLAVGRTLSDSESGIEIKTLAMGGSGADAYADVQVTYNRAPAMTLAEAVDAPVLTWAGSGAPWVGQAVETYDGVDAAASGVIGHNGRSYLETTVTGPGTVSFWWKVSSETDYDFVKFSVNGVVLASDSGSVNWRQKTFTLGAGMQRLVWYYAKDESVVSGSDRAWVDQVVFTPSAAATPGRFETFTLSGGNMTATAVNLMAGTPVAIEVSTNLANWTSVATNVVSGGTLQITRPVAGAREFVRLRSIGTAMEGAVSAK